MGGVVRHLVPTSRFFFLTAGRWTSSTFWLASHWIGPPSGRRCNMGNILIIFILLHTSPPGSWWGVVRHLVPSRFFFLAAGGWTPHTRGWLINALAMPYHCPTLYDPPKLYSFLSCEQFHGWRVSVRLPPPPTLQRPRPDGPTPPPRTAIVTRTFCGAQGLARAPSDKGLSRLPNLICALGPWRS